MYMYWSGEYLILEPKHTPEGLEPSPSPALLMQVHQEEGENLFTAVE